MQNEFRRVFREPGLPWQIHTDKMAGHLALFRQYSA
jgi:hypothetical protein